MPAEADDGGFVVELEVVGEAGDFEFAQNLRVGGIVEADDEEGVDLFEGDEVESVGRVPSREDDLSGSNAINTSHFVKEII